MDLGISGKRAIVCASSLGLGFACANALAREGCHVVINGRTQETLDTAAAALADHGVEITAVQADINTAAGREALVAACPEADILINNNAGPPPGSFSEWSEEDLQAALTANFLAPTFMIQSLVEGMKDRGYGRIVNITSAMVKAPFGAMGLSTSARSALTALCKGISRDYAQYNVTINNLLPERFDTNRQKFMAERIAKLRDISVEEARQEIIKPIPARRMGRPEEFGDTCAFLCNANASFMTGQNVQLDGGSYAGVV